MSLHKSLVAKSTLTKHRNVLSRAERIKKLLEDGRWDESKSSVFGLPKVLSIKLRKKGKKEAKAVEGAEGAEAVAGAALAAGTAPAKGAAPAAAAKGAAPAKEAAKKPAGKR
jgi:small basic protein (TIGR04137 family)